MRNYRIKFLIGSIFLFGLFFLPVSAQAGCCKCLPNSNCLGNQNIDKVACDFYCGVHEPNYQPVEGYPIYSNFCEENTNCPLDKKSCCIKINTYNEKIETCTSNITQEQCNVPITKYIDGQTCEEINCSQGIGQVLSSFLSTEYRPPEKIERLEFTPQVTIPGSVEFGGKVFTINKGQGIEVNGELLSKYIALLFNWLIGAIGVVAVAYMAFGGMQWLAAAGSAEGINKAKETIRDSIIGLLLVVSSYTVLYFINPRLVGFIPLEVTPVGRIELIADGVEPAEGYPSGSLSSSGDKCEAENELVSFPNNINGLTVTASDKRLKPVARDKLVLATTLALNQGYTLQVNSMFRSYAKQEYLYNCYLTKSCNGGNPAAKPDCKTAPHMNGIAVDVCIITPEINTCSYMKQMYNDGKNAGVNSAKLAVAQKKLQEIMKQAGFNRFCGEWWHFEAVNWTSNICEPGIY